MNTSMGRPTTPPPDQEQIDESQHEAREILEDALDMIAEAAYSICMPLNLLPKTAEGDVEFDEDTLEKTGHPTLVAIAKAARAVYVALDTLPPEPEEDKDEEGDD